MITTDKPKKRRKVASSPRLVPRRNEVPRLIRIGYDNKFFGDLYVQLLAMPWLRLLGSILCLYILSNLFFAAIYYYHLHEIENARVHSYEDAFFFSIQTMATIGYGRMAPVGLLVNIMVTIEALWGFSFFAVTTALMFAKFSQPRAMVSFSDVAVISNYNGVPHLKMRLANQRLNRIVDAQVTLVLLRNETTLEGFRQRRFYDLKLLRSHVPLMQLTWTVMHPLDDNSPLKDITRQALEEMDAEIIVSIIGVDETLSQTIHARHSYVSDEIVDNAFFEDVLNRRDDGYVEVNYHLLHATRPVDIS